MTDAKNKGYEVKLSGDVQHPPKGKHKPHHPAATPAEPAENPSPAPVSSAPQEMAAPEEPATAIHGPVPVEMEQIDLYEEKIAQLELALQTAEKASAEEKERALRAVAEMENARKRVLREQEDRVRYANEKLLRDLLPVYDNLLRALALRSNADMGTLADGIELTRKSFLKVIAQCGAEPFDSEGAVFDPEFHEAVSQVETTVEQAGKVHTEVQKGFKLNGRLLRPALVTVGLARGTGTEQAP